MLILFVKSQLALFDTPVMVAGSVRKDGTYVKPHMSVRKKALKPAQGDLFAAPHEETPVKKLRRTKLQVFIDKHGGIARLSTLLAHMSPEQRSKIYASMAQVGGKTEGEIEAMFADSKPSAEPAKGATADLFSGAPEPEKKPEPAAAEPEPEPAAAEPENDIVEHTTGRGKVLRGVVRTDIDQDEAKAIDPYTFRKNGGWFIREKHIGDQAPTAAVEQGPKEGDTKTEDGVEYVLRDGRWHRAQEEVSAAAPAASWESSPFADRVRAMRDSLLDADNETTIGMWRAIEAGLNADMKNGRGIDEKSLSFREQRAQQAIADSAPVKPKVEFVPYTPDSLGAREPAFLQLPQEIAGAAISKLNALGEKLAEVGYPDFLLVTRNSDQAAQPIAAKMREVLQAVLHLAPERYRAEKQHKNANLGKLDRMEEHASEVLGIDTKQFPGIKTDIALTASGVRAPSVKSKKAAAKIAKKPVEAVPEQSGLLMGSDGKPVVVYHGTSAEFDAFDRKASVTKFKRPESIDSIGSWFTSDPVQAGQYGGKLIAANLELRNPMVFDTFEAMREEWNDWNDSRWIPKEAKALHKKNTFWGDSDGFVESLKRQGYDGIEIKPHASARSTEFEGRSTYIVFDGSQVKRVQANDKPVAAVNPAEPVERGPFGVVAGTTKGERRTINAKVVELVTSGKTEFSDAEKALLRQYSGNGGCGDSLNEFYTDPDVAAAMWTALRSFGFNGGSVLEPSCATGVFMHTAPADVKVTGVELDPISSKVAQVLHGDRHEIRNASLERFATSDGDRQFDLVIGNCPFGLRGSLIKDDKPELKTAEAYFMDTALDKTKAGGMVAMIVPTGVMDAKSNRALRERLLRKGEFLGAARMPNTAFEHSHTEVTTDVLFFRKRPDDVAGALMTIPQDTLKDLGVWDDEYLSGGYFEGRGAPNIYGTMEAGWRAKAGIGQDITVSGSMAGVPAELAKWTPDEFTTATPDVPAVLDALGDDEAAKKRALGGAARVGYDNSKVGDTKVVDGVTYILQGNPPRWHRVDEFMQDGAVTDAQAIAANISALMIGRTDVDRAAVEAAVRTYIATHGNPSKNTNLQVAATQDRSLYRLIGAVNPDGTLSDVVTGRASRRVEGSLDTVAQSLAVEHESGTFSVAELASRIGKDEETVEDTLFASSAYAYAGDGQWTTMDQYLTGDLWSKLDRVREEVARGDLRDGVADKYALQARKLEETIDPKSLEDVEIQINSAFVPTDVLSAFFNDRKNDSDNKWIKDQPDIKITFEGGLYKIENQGYQYGILEKYLNRTGVRKDDMDKIDEWNTGFKDWLVSSRYRDQVEDLYNRKFRGFRQQEYSDATIAIPGMVTDGLKQYQYSGLRWALAAGKGIVAADVGLGKTVRGLMLAKMAKLNGTAKKPTFVVPKSVLANWVAEADKWFPGSRVLVIGETYTRDNKTGELKSKQDSAADRNRKLHELTQNDYDFVFISQPAFNDIDLDPVTKGQYVNDDFWVQRGDKLGNAGDKRLKKIREAHDQAVADRDFRKRTDAIYFNELGIDMMMVDEGHAFKNLYAARARFGESPKFLGGQGLSNRALDMNLKTRWVREQNAGKGIFMLTATPTKNSPLEIYSMLSHVAPEAFERIGIRNSEEFLDRFCEFTNDKILGTDGTIQDALVTTGFKNLDELRDIMKRYIDRKTAADVGLKLPERNDEMHMIDMTDEQKSVYDDLRQQMADLANNKDSTGDAHIFSIMDKMAKAAMDLELLDSKAYKGARSPKYAKAAANIVNGAKDGGQVVFAENVAAHEKLADELVKAGIPRDQIAIINAQEADSSAKRQNIADAFNAGKIKVVIGNKTMEEGINLQKATSDIHHLDLPWEPASMQQRNGRGLRQGNTNEAVRIHTYITKGSFDGYRYQSMMAKKDWQDILWSGGDRIDNMAREGRFDRSDLLVMMSADPEAERAKLAADKDAAQARYDGEQRRAAASEFVRFQVMKRSYRDLQNKKSMSAERLRAKIEGAKTKLANNKYFSARAALDSDQPVVIQPDTGIVLQKNVGIVAAEKDGTTQKWVITEVNPTTGDVTMRRYAAMGASAKKVTIPAHQLNDGVEPFKFDEEAEAGEVKAELEKQAADKVNHITDWNDVKTMPSNALEAAHDVIQAQLKRGAKDHSVRFPYGKIPMIDKATGKPVLVDSSYSAATKADTHDFLLPTDANMAKLEEAWMDSERGKKFTKETFTKRRGGKSEWRNKVKYPDGGYGNDHANPWASVMREMHGEKESYGTESAPKMQALAKRFEKQQIEHIRRAPTFKEALDSAFALAQLHGSAEGSRPVWNKRAIATLWARARHEGLLGAPIKEHVPTASIHAGGNQYPKHDGYSYHRPGYSGEDKDIHGTLRDIAAGSGHKDLANAIAVSGARHGAQDVRDAIGRLHGTNTAEGHWSNQTYTYEPAVLHTILKLAEQAGIADTPMRDAGIQMAGYGMMTNNGHKTFRQAIHDQLEKQAK